MMRAYNPKYPGGGDRIQDHYGQKVSDSLSQKKQAGHGMCTHNSSYIGSGGKRNIVQGYPRQKHETLAKKKTKKKNN
jgi:hypothetical protein